MVSFFVIMLHEIGHDTPASHRVPQIGQRAKYPPIAPIPILRCQTYHQASRSDGVFGGDQGSVSCCHRTFERSISDAIVEAFLVTRWSRSPEELAGRVPSPWPPDVGVDYRSAGGACRPIALGVLDFPPAGSRSRHAAADPTTQRPKSAATGRDRRSGTLRQDTSQNARKARGKLPRLNQIEFLDITGLRPLNQCTHSPREGRNSA